MRPTFRFSGVAYAQLRLDVLGVRGCLRPRQGAEDCRRKPVAHLELLGLDPAAKIFGNLLALDHMGPHRPRPGQAPSPHRPADLHHDRRPSGPPGHLGADLGTRRTQSRHPERGRACIPCVHTSPHFSCRRKRQAGTVRARRSTPTTTLNTSVGEWPDTDRQTRTIVDSALGHVPRMCPDTTQGRRTPSWMARMCGIHL
jgi:hypothetical protein